MRVALCLHGVVGNYYTHKENYISNGDVDFRIGMEHYQKHLFKMNENVDVFIHSWSTQYADEINDAYQPRKQLFQEQIDFEQSSTALNYLKSRWYSTKTVVDLKQSYEEENGFKYDWVMLSRFDLALLRNLIFKDYDNQVFYAARHAYVPQFPGEEPCPNMNDGFCDYWFFSNSDIIDRFSRLYDYWEEYGIFDAHCEAYHHVRQLGVKVGFPMTGHFDLAKWNDFELVRLFYRDCLYSDKGFAGIQNLTRI